jgi:hypothetical protein
MAGLLALKINVRDIKSSIDQFYMLEVEIMHLRNKRASAIYFTCTKLTHFKLCKCL